MLSMVRLAGAASLPGQITDGSKSAEYRRTLERTGALSGSRVWRWPRDPACDQETCGAGRPLRWGFALDSLAALVGDIPEVYVPASSDVYDATLAAAVKRFQSRHGLEPDGRLGKEHSRNQRVTWIPWLPAFVPCWSHPIWPL